MLLFDVIVMQGYFVVVLLCYHNLIAIALLLSYDSDFEYKNLMKLQDLDY